MLLRGAQAPLQVRARDWFKTLSDAKFRVFSRCGENGTINWLVSRLPSIPETIAEFGAETSWMPTPAC